MTDITHLPGPTRTDETQLIDDAGEHLADALALVNALSCRYLEQQADNAGRRGNPAAYAHALASQEKLNHARTGISLALAELEELKNALERGWNR